MVSYVFILSLYIQMDYVEKTKFISISEIFLLVKLQLSRVDAMGKCRCDSYEI